MIFYTYYIHVHVQCNKCTSMLFIIKISFYDGSYTSQFYVHSYVLSIISMSVVYFIFIYLIMTPHIDVYNKLL